MSEWMRIRVSIRVPGQDYEKAKAIEDRVRKALLRDGIYLDTSAIDLAPQ